MTVIGQFGVYFMSDILESLQDELLMSTCLLQWFWYLCCCSAILLRPCNVRDWLSIVMFCQYLLCLFSQIWSVLAVLTLSLSSLLYPCSWFSSPPPVWGPTLSLSIYSATARCSHGLISFLPHSMFPALNYFSLSLDYRNVRLMKEIEFLWAHAVCLLCLECASPFFGVLRRDCWSLRKAVWGRWNTSWS